MLYLQVVVLVSCSKLYSETNMKGELIREADLIQGYDKATFPSFFYSFQSRLSHSHYLKKKSNNLFMKAASFSTNRI